MAFYLEAMCCDPLAGQQNIDECRRFLERSGAREVLDSEYEVEFSDGDAVRIVCEELRKGERFEMCSFRPGGLSEEECNFLYEFARHADLVILNGTEDDTLILTHEAQEEGLLDGMRESYDNIACCKSGRELKTLLEDGYEEFLNMQERDD